MKAIFSRHAVRDTAIMVGLLSQAFHCYADPPPAGSEQAKIMAPASGFIRNAKAPAPEYDPSKEEFLVPYQGFVLAAGSKAQGWCCNMHDGRASLPSRPAPSDGGTDVFATLEAYPKLKIEPKDLETVDGKQGKWIHFPPENIISGDLIRKTYTECMAGAGKDNGNRGTWTAETCDPPDFNIAWIEPENGRAYCYYAGAPKLVLNDPVKNNPFTPPQTTEVYALTEIPKQLIPGSALIIPTIRELN